MRIAFQCRDHFRKLQRRIKLVSSFRGGEGVSFQCDLGLKKKKKIVFLGKGGGGRMRQRREKCFPKIKSATVLPLALIGQTLSCPEPLWP